MKFKSFNECWAAICRLLTPRPELYHWSEAGRASGSSAISSVGWEGIGVITAKKSRFVPRRDFERLYPYWEDYSHGQIHRSRLNFCVNTTYVLSIFHWLTLQTNTDDEQTCYRR
jgi:hypothetical protein